MATAAKLSPFAQIKRPAGITAICGLLLASALALLALTLIHHHGGLMGVFRLVAVVGLASFTATCAGPARFA